MAATFRKIMNLPDEASDNRARAARVNAYGRENLASAASFSLLDVGSGLAVFPAAMKELGWSCTALDPDSRGAEHARSLAGVEAMAADFMTVSGIARFDVISFNKVLEHVLDPVAMLSRAKDFLTDGGFIYVELPDGEAALEAGPERLLLWK